VTLRELRAELSAWLDDNTASFEQRAAGASLVDEVARSRANQRRLWDAGWLRQGWSEVVGGLGDSSLVRAAVAEQLSARGLVYEPLFAVAEVLAPPVVDAAPDLAATYLPSFLGGTEGWCQGFSEPDAGSDLASLRCRAVDDGDHWVVTGQKIWTSYAQFASRIVLLARTGTPEARHRGITAMLVDMDAPGLTVQPLPTINGMEEFSHTFFEDVRVPKERLIGEVNGGWRVAMDMLRSERGGIFWMFSMQMLEQLHHVLREADLDAADDEAVGRVFLSIAGVRARTWMTQHRVAGGTIASPETSIDKILMAGAEQELFDVVRASFGGVLEFADDDDADDWRSHYMYSRAASIYGGSGEIQRNIVADQLLGLRGAS
jgi:alkylation response protein AidB-like acyl-CoA dehydrogenase